MSSDGPPLRLFIFGKDIKMTFESTKRNSPLEFLIESTKSITTHSAIIHHSSMFALGDILETVKCSWYLNRLKTEVQQ